MPQSHNSELPDFVLKSTLTLTLAAVLILTPFTINDFIQGRYLLAFLTSIVLILCSIDAWLCAHNKYSLKLNLFGISPLLVVTIVIATYNLGVAGSYWAYIGIIGFYFTLPLKPAWIVNIIFIIILSPVAWLSLEPEIAARFFAVLFGISFFTFAATREIYKQYFVLKEQSVTDILTGLYNRSLLQSSLESAIHQSDRSNTKMAILMLDIDDFKMINDQFGHDVGDSVLKSTGDFLKKAFRTSDIVFRIGGEEFLALIYNTDKIDAVNVAEKLRQEFEQRPLIPGKTITISIGVSNLQSDMDWKQWMKKGDENLYKAKSNGRNQVVA